MKNLIRIASGQGFWGDLPSAPLDQVRKGPIDYLVMDYLAEVTMSIMQKQRMRNPDSGYARDFVEMLEQFLPEISEKRIKVISNAGGINPDACKNAIVEIAERQNIKNLKIAVVSGDDILPRVDELLTDGYALDNMETGETLETVKSRLLSANVYFGSKPVLEALQKGADIIVTGRVTDTGLTLAPMIHEFGWQYEDYDKLAAGTIAGHIIECGGQVSGGNFTDWKNIPDLADIGFPIIEAYPDSQFYVTKHKDTGGQVSEMTVKEQLLYEIGNPEEYITPDVIADFTTVQLEEVANNRVKVSGIKGRKETDTYKVSASYYDGYKLSASLVYCWPDPVKKALSGAEILKKRADKLGINLESFRSELVGINACDENINRLDDDLTGINEVEMRISVRGPSRKDLDTFGKEIAPLILTGPSGVTGFAGGRPKSSEIIAYWPALLEKSACKPNVTVYEL